MQLTRRDALMMGAGAVAATLIPAGAPRAAPTLDEAIAAFTGGATPGEGGVTITAPEIAENGNTVPIEVDAPGASSIMLLADGNPNPAVCTFHFGPLAGAQMAATRIRLARTQNVLAVARLADGSYGIARREVKVTIGGCGG
ncbi:MAG: thiosulfate oxidation carrier protein SoxY [Alphaproteobacteria bacterium]|nr:MAG: thiosulfate oxidation carrier protein SoxY [Alphaproteobacteria bacterium]